MSETMTLTELERELKEARLRGAQDHTPVWITAAEYSVETVTFTGSLNIR